MISRELLTTIRRHYRLDWYGTHGVIHWSRVYAIGMKLAVQEGVNRAVVQLFSVFHDGQRRNEYHDENHGGRGAQLALKLRDLCHVSGEEFQLLVTACSLHTTTRDHKDITVQACFDADRLDLGRIGKIPNLEYLCTPMAKTEHLLNWAYEQSLTHELPANLFGLSDSDAKMI